MKVNICLDPLTYLNNVQLSLGATFHFKSDYHLSININKISICNYKVIFEYIFLVQNTITDDRDTYSYLLTSYRGY